MKIKTLKKDTSALSMLPGINREIYPAQVTKLAGSLERMGCIRPLVVCNINFITGKPGTYIVDGQHLYLALIRESMSIPYITIEIKDQKELIEKIALLNASSKSWKMLDYVTAWSSIKNDYKKLNKYYGTYDLDFATLSTVLGGLSFDGSNGLNVMKRGGFKIVDEEKNVRILNRLTDVLKVLPRENRFRNKYVCREYVSFYRKNEKSYKHLTFLTNLKKSKVKFELAVQKDFKLSAVFATMLK